MMLKLETQSCNKLAYIYISLHDVHWIVFVTPLYMYYALCFVHVEDSVCHEPISVLINIFMLLA